MESAKLNDWMQVVGIFAVVASLIFVGMEMQQSQKIALSAAYQARSDSSMSLRMAPFESETLQSAMAKTYIQEMSIDQLTPEERIVLRGRWNTQLVYLENVHYQYANGFISEEHWQTNRAELTGMLRRAPEWRRAMVENCAINRASFCAEIRAASERIELGKE
jgi:hypothetical protein